MVAQDVERSAVGGEREPLHHVSDRAVVEGRGQEQLRQDVGSGLGPEVALLARVDGGGEEVAGEPVRALQGFRVRQGVPPHGARGVGDLLRVHRPHPPHPAAGVEAGRIGVTGGLVTGQQYGAGRGQNRGDRQRGGLPGARCHDRHRDVLVPHPDLGPGPLEVAQEDSGVGGRDAVGVLQAGAQAAGLCGDRVGQERLDVPCLRGALDPALVLRAEGALVAAPPQAADSGEGNQGEYGNDSGTDQQGRFSQAGPELVGAYEGVGGPVGGTGVAGGQGGEVPAEPGEVGEGDGDGEQAQEDLEGYVVAVG